MRNQATGSHSLVCLRPLAASQGLTSNHALGFPTSRGAKSDLGEDDGLAESVFFFSPRGLFLMRPRFSTYPQ
jgi:hypothetical protein